MGARGAEDARSHMRLLQPRRWSMARLADNSLRLSHLSETLFPLNNRSFRLSAGLPHFKFSVTSLCSSFQKQEKSIHRKYSREQFSGVELGVVAVSQHWEQCWYRVPCSPKHWQTWGLSKNGLGFSLYSGLREKNRKNELIFPICTMGLYSNIYIVFYNGFLLILRWSGSLHTRQLWWMSKDGRGGKCWFQLYETAGHLWKHSSIFPAGVSLVIFGRAPILFFFSSFLWQ